MNAKLIFCELIQDELEAAGKGKIVSEPLLYALHRQPSCLRQELWKAIDEARVYDTILLGYGLCGMAAIGLKAVHSNLIIPKVEDCIHLLLGSRERYRAVFTEEPGTYYLTKGLIDKRVDPFSQFCQGVPKYGREKCLRLIKRAMSGYKRFALIDTGTYKGDKYRKYAQKAARLFNFKYVEIEGSLAILKKLFEGNWDEDFVVLKKGEAITQDMFGY